MIEYTERIILTSFSFFFFFLIVIFVHAQTKRIVQEFLYLVPKKKRHRNGGRKGEEINISVFIDDALNNFSNGCAFLKIIREFLKISDFELPMVSFLGRCNYITLKSIKLSYFYLIFYLYYFYKFNLFIFFFASI